MNYIIAIIIITYLYVSIRNQIRIIKSHMINRKQKFINSVLLWFIPFIWAIIVKESLRPISGSLLSSRKDMSSGSKMDDAGAIGITD